MGLGIERIQAELKSPSKRIQINEALRQQERIKFHADTNLTAVNGRPYNDFKLYLQSLLPKDKYLTCLNFLKFPIPTNAITESIFTKLSKVFDGRNPAIDYQFTKSEDKEDWAMYRARVLGEPSVWSNKMWDYFKTEINCVLVVDMPKEARDGKTSPYFYPVPMSSVVSYEVNPMTGNMAWFMYLNQDGNLVVIDEETYRTFDLRDSSTITALLSESPHGLGYCPARFFWNEPLSLSNPDVKKSPLSKELSNLDYYLFRVLSKDHLDLYASFPIYSGYEEECDYTDAEGNSCYHGHLQKPDGTMVLDVNGNPVACPLCQNKKTLAGAGSYIEVPVPRDGNPDMRNPIQLLGIDRESLDYAVEDLERLKKSIIASCVGVDSTIINEASLADKQVDASYESKDNVLNRIKKGFEEAQKWVDSTICRLRYGVEFLSCSINYGTEFYTLTPEVLQKRYNTAKEGGASDTELDALRTQLIETEYRHNPMQMQRMLILSELEPYRHLKKSEVLNLYNNGLISAEEVILKNDFSGFIAKFERENTNILDFGKEVSHEDKISTIYNTILEYAKQRKSNKSDISVS